MDEFSIQYKGFSPSQFTKQYLNSVIAKVHDEAPSSSSMKVTITKARRDFKGYIRIASAAGTFFIVATSPRLPELAQQLLERARRQLDKWKTKRFDHKTIRGLFSEVHDGFQKQAN